MPELNGSELMPMSDYDFSLQQYNGLMQQIAGLETLLRGLKQQAAAYSRRLFLTDSKPDDVDIPVDIQSDL